MQTRGEKRTMAFTAAGIYAGAAAIGIVEGLIPGGQELSPAPAFAALALAAFAALAGPRLPRPLLALLGPIGVVIIGVALAGTDEYGDGAVLYVWPALWTAWFVGTRGAVAIVVWIGIVHALALLSMPDGHASVDRWIDVVVALAVVVVVVRLLAARNERLLQRLADQARIDPLTGLLNRRGFEERAAVERARAQREGSSLAVATFDIDHFKRVNDEHGHDVGDRVLTSIGRTLTEHVRGIDVAARLGGEEFVVLLPRTGVAGAHALAERVRTAVSSDEMRQQRARAGLPPALHVTVSGGVAAAAVAEGGANAGAAMGVQALLDAADRAMYAAKRAGRDRVALAGEELAAATR